jgi:Protein of unknown function (DUF2723)
MPDQPARGATHTKWLIACVAVYAAALILTIGKQSLWTDEAFSAYIACHRSLSALVSTLTHGDSSDLQAALYYVYLHGWTVLFGSSEVALRAANIPFIAIFSTTLIWVSWRVFRSHWLWIPPAFLPFFWNYAGEARAYFALTACSAVCFTCVLVWLEGPSEKERRILPWVALSSLLLGTAFHMLMLLALPPLLVVILLHALRKNGGIEWRSWIPALQIFSVPFALLSGYLGWTFLRGTAYDYLKPDILSMASVFYRLVGLSGYGPNRRFDIPFRPYVPGIAAASLILLIVIGCAVVARRRKPDRLLLTSLVWAFLLGLSEVVVLSFVVKMQVDVRHLAALTPLLVLLFLAAFNNPLEQKTRSLAFAASLLLAGVWFVADCRMLFLSEYKDEDFRSAVGVTKALYQSSKADVALVADPAGGGYYGLDLQGAAPCFPLVDDCGTALSKAEWAKQVPATEALLWKRPEITAWLDERARKKIPVIVIMSLGRHPMIKESDWWPVLRSKQLISQHQVQGFSIFQF